MLADIDTSGVNCADNQEKKAKEPIQWFYVILSSCERYISVNFSQVSF